MKATGQSINVVPVVTETTGMKRIYISPSVMVEQIAPHNGVKYTANISAGERIKDGKHHHTRGRSQRQRTTI